jgi:acetoin utilization deacetylase AcuC-like enzyme
MAKDNQMKLAAIPVFYREEMVASFESFSPSAGKPREVVSSWTKLDIPLDIRKPEPVTERDISLAHSLDYTQAILTCRLNNGFGNNLPSVAASLPFTIGAMIDAGKEAIHNRLAAVAPCSGFHHAGYDKSCGYCTFNGLVIAARVLQRDGLAKKVGILDFDMHYGNGTDEIVSELGLFDLIVHFTAGGKYFKRDQAKSFLMSIPELVRTMGKCDVILYQAGADPHVDDPLGGWLTTEQLAERDWHVFATAKRIGVPIAWNLAGGYQTDSGGSIRPILDIHDNTMKECADVFLRIC